MYWIEAVTWIQEKNTQFYSQFCGWTSHVSSVPVLWKFARLMLAHKCLNTFFSFSMFREMRLSSL